MIYYITNLHNKYVFIYLKTNLLICVTKRKNPLNRKCLSNIIT